AATHSCASFADDTWGNMIPSAPQSNTLAIVAAFESGTRTIIRTCSFRMVRMISGSCDSGALPCSRSSKSQSKEKQETRSATTGEPVLIQVPMLTELFKKSLFFFIYLFFCHV